MSCSKETAWLTGTEDGMLFPPVLLPPAVGVVYTARVLAAAGRWSADGEPILSSYCERQRRRNLPSRERQYRHLGERRAQDSGARLKGSGRRSGKKRPARVKARRSLVL
ncbi:unnamed protein product, partial [Ectocarpus sp. 12 AP-2014]